MTPIFFLKGKQISAHLRVLEKKSSTKWATFDQPCDLFVWTKKQKTIHLSTAKLSAHTRHLNDFTCSNNEIKPNTVSEI